jgi:hypothetical protein
MLRLCLLLEAGQRGEGEMLQLGRKGHQLVRPQLLCASMAGDLHTCILSGLRLPLSGACPETDRCMINYLAVSPTC